jgi:phage gpG-like protein
LQDPFKIPIEKLHAAIARAQPRLVHALGVEALGFIDDNFAKQAFQGAVITQWPGRKKKEKGKLRKILVKTGTLRRSFRAEDSLTHTTISTDIPYAKIHNYGGTINHPGGNAILNFRGKKGKLRLTATQTETQQRRVKQIRRASIGAHTITMPRRQFIGPSPVLTRRCKKALNRILLEEIKKTR